MTVARVGLGVDFKYADRYPGGLSGVVSRWRQRMSHLSIVDVRTVDDAAAILTITGSLPIVHHLSNVSPGDPDGPHLERLRHQDTISRALGAVWCGEDIGIWSLGPFGIPYFAPSPLAPDVAHMVGERIRTVIEHSSIPFLAEIPSCSFTIGQLSLGDFFRTLVECSACGIVLDVSHVFSYALSVGRAPDEVLSSLPLDSVVEIHIAGGRVNRTHPFRYIDSHSDPIMDEVIALFRRAVRSCPELRAVTYEIGVQLETQQIARDFERVDQLLSEEGFRPCLIAARPLEAQG